MGLTHLTFYTDKGLNSKALSEKLNIPYFRANRLVNGRVFMLIDEYKQLVDNVDMEEYDMIKRDYDLHNNKRVLIESTDDLKVFFYPKQFHITAIDNSYDILWSAICHDKEDATKLWNNEKQNLCQQ